MRIGLEQFGDFRSAFHWRPKAGSDETDPLRHMKLDESQAEVFRSYLYRLPFERFANLCWFYKGVASAKYPFKYREDEPNDPRTDWIRRMAGGGQGPWFIIIAGIPVMAGSWQFKHGQPVKRIEVEKAHLEQINGLREAVIQWRKDIADRALYAFYSLQTRDVGLSSHLLKARAAVNAVEEPSKLIRLERIKDIEEIQKALFNYQGSRTSQTFVFDAARSGLEVIKRALNSECRLGRVLEPLPKTFLKASGREFDPALILLKELHKTETWIKGERFDLPSENSQRI